MTLACSPAIAASQRMGDQAMGSIAKGKLANFFLVPGDCIKDVKDGT